MASSSEPQRTYHVFVSFRGTDTRNNFVAHLYRALDQRGIHTYMDNEELRKGECLSPALMKAIEESHIAIVTFSENYATSPFCLDEIAKIMEYKERNELIVLPVFYKVEPREVRGQRDSYGRALAKHERKFGKDSEKLKKWKKALFDAGSLSGWYLNDGDEAELIQSIIKEILIMLDRTPLNVAKYPVGINSRVEELKSILSTKPEDDVCMVGLWGLGGIGKTTMAKAIYNALSKQFAGSSFLARVRETSEKANDLAPLQAQLLSEILADKALTVSNVDRGMNLIRERLCCKKVLVILDDVDHMDQLNALAGACDWFGKGSRIIITTRDKHLLTSHGIGHVYEVRPLDDGEAYELFSQHCFARTQSIEVSENIIQNTLHYANGLPLALEVLGSFLRGRDELEWKSMLTKLANSPEQTINRVLKTSFDALEDNEKAIFLDIACFFKGCNIEYVKKVMESCGFHSTIGMEVLIERALISHESGTLQMHDLVQLMGRDVVNQECPDNPSKRSRLWLYDDVLDVFSEDKGTDALKAIRLAMPLPEEITVAPDAFANMKKLRSLILLDTHVSFPTPICLPSELRWLEWPKCSAATLEFSSGPKKLVGLNVQRSHIKELGLNFKQFKNLKFLDFSYCKSLVCIPDLSGTPYVEMLDLHGCENLVEVHHSVGFLSKLEVLSLSNCSKLTLFPDVLKSRSLREFSLAGCSKLEKFPEIPEQMDCLQELHLDGSAIKELPASIENIVSLERIFLSSCRNLTTLPSSVYNLQRLKYMTLEGCSKFVQFPMKLDDSTDPHGSLGFRELDWLDLTDCNLSEVEFLDNLSCFTALRMLYLSGNNISSLPPSIKERGHLYDLRVEKCEQLREIPELPSIISVLKANSCKSLCKIPNLSSQAGDFLEVELSSCPLLVREGWSMSDILPLMEIHEMRRANILVSGHEMPSWLLPGEEGSISFMVPQELYGKFVGLAICGIFEFGDEIVDYFGCEVQIFVNGKRVSWHKRFFRSLESDHVWLEYHRRSALWEVDKYLRNDWSPFNVCMKPSHGILKNCGFRLICKQQEDDLKVVLRHEQMTELDLPFVDSPECTNSEEDNKVDSKDNSLTWVDRMPLHIPVGINFRVEELKSMLSMESKDDVRMVGLWGLGGIGKTTLAKALYDAFFRQFVGSCFLAHVRETSKKANDLVPLQAQLLCEILADKTLTFFNIDGGIELIKKRLRCKKILLVLDDVDHLDQLNALVGSCDWFGKGSRIIVTTRDKHLLTSHGIYDVYEVKPLNDEEAYELFGLHCFQGNQSTKISEDIIQNALDYANGLPLALEVLGSSLRGRNEFEWKSTLAKLADCPDQTINQVLKTSFDVLEHNEKEIFLDIACFFKGCETEYVKNVMDSCGFYSSIGLEVLIERALISNENGVLQMHGLVQLMGRNIVSQECPDDSSKRSRLWFYDDVWEVLLENKVTNAIQAIKLVLPSPKKITISADAFTNMKNLRLLILRNTHVSLLSSICLPSELRWLEWPECSAPSLEFSTGLKKLVGLNVSKSCIRESGMNFKQFKNLKFIDLSNCKSLVCTPDLSHTPNLEILDLSGCVNLVKVHDSVGFLCKLEVLLLEHCSEFTLFPNLLNSNSLRRFSVNGCSKLERFPEIPKQMHCLQELHLDLTAIKELPASIENIVSLEHMYLRHCRNLTTLPSNVYNLQRLKYLSLEGCSNFTEFPKKMDDLAGPCGSLGFRELNWLDLTNCNLSEVEFLDNLSCFTALRRLYLSGNNINSLPSSINKREYLEDLRVEKCEQLHEIPELPSAVSTLKAGHCKSLHKIPNLSGLARHHLEVDFSSCPELARGGMNVSDILPLEEIHEMEQVDILVSGDEMPSWLLRREESSIPFMVPQALYNNIVGLAICVVFGLDDTVKHGFSCEVQISINGRRVGRHTRYFYSLELDHVWFEYHPLRNIVKYLRNDCSRFIVSIRPSDGILKSCGFRLICKQQEDDLKVVLWHEGMTESNLLLVDIPEHTDSEEDDKIDSEDNSLTQESNIGHNDSELKWLQPLWKGCLALAVGLTAALLSKRRAKVLKMDLDSIQPQKLADELRNVQDHIKRSQPHTLRNEHLERGIIWNG